MYLDPRHQPRPRAADPASFAVLIPARHASSRFPGKPLALLRGAGGEAKPLIERSWEAARRAVVGLAGCAGVWVATDDERIAKLVRTFGGEVVMTSPYCRNGTERCADAAGRLGVDADYIVNLQGDAPLTPPAIIGDLVAALAADGEAAMATAAMACSAQTYAHIEGDAAAGRVGATTVVVSARGRALYFSKRVLPFVPGEAGEAAYRAVRLHLGLYAYRPSALAVYAALPPSPLEMLEGLEQLRFLDAELPVRVVSDGEGGRDWGLDRDCIELDNPQDLPLIEAVLARRGIA